MLFEFVVCWYDPVLRRMGGNLVRRALEFEVEGQWNEEGRPKKHERVRMRKKV